MRGALSHSVCRRVEPRVLIDEKAQPVHEIHPAAIAAAAVVTSCEREGRASYCFHGSVNCSTDQSMSGRSSWTPERVCDFLTSQGLGVTAEQVARMFKHRHIWNGDGLLKHSKPSASLSRIHDSSHMHSGGSAHRRTRHAQRVRQHQRGTGAIQNCLCEASLSLLSCHDELLSGDEHAFSAFRRCAASAWRRRDLYTKLTGTFIKM